MNDVYVKDGVEYRPVLVINADYAQYLEGNLLTYIEMLGLPETQEEALKSKVRQSIWGGCFLKGEHLNAEEAYRIKTEFITPLIEKRIAEMKAKEK